MIDIGIELFAHKGENIEVIDTPIGRTGGALDISECRPAGIMNGAKISSAAALFDILLKYPGTIAFAICKDLRMSYIEISGANFFVTEKDFVMGDASLPIKPKYRASVMVLNGLVFGGNKELETLFKKILADWKSSHLIDKGDVYKYCDSFYYGYAKTAEVDERTITQAEVEATIRSNQWEIYNFGSPELFKAPSMVTFDTKKKKAAKKSASTSSFFADIKAGKYKIAYAWPEEVKRKIVPTSYLDNFVVTAEFEELVKKVKYRADKVLTRLDMGMEGADAIGKDALNILLLGKPGTGKTTIAYALSAACGIPICTTAHTKHTDEDEYEGKTKIVDSKPTFVETDSLLMHRYGGIDVCEEINLADPSVTMGGLGQKLEFPFIVKANGFETVVRNPLNIVIGTMNVGTNGSNPLNQALANRFKTSFLLDDPTKETFIEILIKASKKSREVCEWVHSAYEETIEWLKSPQVGEEDICQNLSIRTCLGALENMEEGQTPKRALVNSIIGAIAVVDLEVARKCQAETIDLLPEFTGDLYSKEV